MKRKIKYRVWLDDCDAFEYPDAITLHKDGSVETDKSRGGILQQYTGLKDKNGKEVYEGDIVYDRVTADYGDKRMDYFEVSYNNEYSAFVLLRKPNEDGWRSWTWIRNIKSYGEIVGNIFENPKLIKKPKKNKVVKKNNL